MTDTAAAALMTDEERGGGVGVTGQEAVIREALNDVVAYRSGDNTDQALDALAALVAERDAYLERLDEQVAWRQREEVARIEAVAERDRLRQTALVAYETLDEWLHRRWHLERSKELAQAVAERDEAQSRERHSNRQTHELAAHVRQLAAHVRQAVAERDRYRETMEMLVSPRTLMSRDQMREAMRAALAVSTP